MIVHALRQLRRDLPVTAILLAALALVTGFAALAPLYVQMVAAAELDSRLALLTPRQQRLELSDAQPVAADSLTPLEDALGATLLATHRFGYAPARICGLRAEDGLRASYIACIRQYTYPDLGAEFSAVEGRLPQPAAGVIEFALTRGVLEKSARLAADYRITVGSQYGIHDGQTQHTLRLVGIVEPRVPEFAPHWDGQQSVFGTIILSTGNQPDELDIGLLVHPDVLAAPDGIDAPAQRQYVTRAALDLTHIRAAELDALGARLDDALASVRRANPTVTVLSPVSALISDFQARLAEVGQPVLLLVALTLVLLLYTLTTTGGLILERSRTGWAQMAGRGAGALQLLTLHAVGMGTLGVLAWLLGIPLALAFAAALALIGPQAGVVTLPALTDMPTASFATGGAAALLAVAALLLPAIPTAFTSFARLKSEAGRPASSPLWARYFVDVVLVVTGLAFTVRARDAFDLADPFTLAGPALLLTGVALLWLRIFPLLMRAVGAAVAALNRFGLRMAFWELERASGSYSQLVVLVVGALALGTASLVLTQTRMDGAWQQAQAHYGADVQITLAPEFADRRFDYAALDGVTAATPFILIDPDGAQTPVLLGYAGADAPQIAGLRGEVHTPAGRIMPEGARSLALDVLAVPQDDDPPMLTRLTLEIINGDGLRVPLPLVTPDETLDGVWMTYTADLDPAALGAPPYRIGALYFASLRPSGASPFGPTNRLDQTLHIGGLIAVMADGGAVTLLDPGDPAAPWTRPAVALGGGNGVLTFTSDAEVPSPDGAPSLRVLYTRSGTTAGRSPALILDASDEPIPVLINAAFARMVGERSPLRRTLTAGDDHFVDVRDPRQPERLLRVRFRVAAVELAPTPASEPRPALWTRADWLQGQVNRSRASLDDGTGINRVHLMLDTRQPPNGLRAQIAAVPGVETTAFAYDRYGALQRAPLANAVTGMLFAGFCAAFGLIVLQAGFYTAFTLRKRAGSFAVLHALGWGMDGVTRMLAVEQAAVIAPAVVIGTVTGAGLAALLLPLLGDGQATLQFPAAQIGALVLAIVVLFAVLTAGSAAALRQTGMDSRMREAI